MYAQNDLSVDVENQDNVDYYFQLANFNKKNNNFKNSIEYIQKAIVYAELKNDKQAKADAYSFLGTLYFNISKYDDAIETFKKCTAIYDGLPSTSNKAYSYYYLGLTYIEKEDYFNAEHYFNEAEKIYNEINIGNANELLKLQKAKVYLANNEIKTALDIFNSIASIKDDEDTFKTKAEALYQIGVIESLNNRNNLALNYLNRAITLSQKNNNLELNAKILKELSKVSEKMLNVNQAYGYLKKHIETNDSIRKINKQRLGTEDYISFKESERVKKIEEMDKENKEQMKANKFSKLISILSIALICILSLLSLSLYKNNVIRSQTNQLLQDKNNELQLAKEKAEQASKARADFLSTVSHELRTPLNAINGITHLLLEENPKKSQYQYLTSLKFSGDYLLNFINDILEINRVESENIEIEKINVNIKQLLDDIYNSFKEVAGHNGNELVLDVDENIPEHLIGDPTKLSQIFINLINNALKFTKEGTVIISAKIVKSCAEMTTISFKIIDNGIGIPPDKQKTVFESFSQGSVEINRKYGGTGLGLAIVKRLVSLLGGEIQLESVEKAGSTFYFDLEFKIGQQSFIEDLKQYDESVFSNKKILVVEDNKINQMITKKMVENKGIVCELVDNGEDAIELVRHNNYDLVLMDVHLPGINGTEATQDIREFNPQIPIVALTAISLNENREMLLSYGIDDVITKPFNPDNFYKIIAQQLSKN
jgi:signal transduction histidine kinase/CheY-like chemotaxis protein